MMQPTQNAGALATCERCGRQCQVAPSRREDSKPFRLAKVPKGVCPECVMTQFLYTTYPVNMQIDEAGPELLLNPMIPQAFEMSGLLQGCDLSIEEINWQRVVDNWKLPVKVKHDGRNPYRMGESPRARSRGAGTPAETEPQLGLLTTPPTDDELKRVLRRAFDRPLPEKPN